MEKEYITILIANYNNGEYLEECVESLLSQTSDRWKAIIVDDKSSDNSFEIYKKYQNHEKIKIYYNQQNIGYIGTLKKLIELSESDIVGILDPDDKLDETCLEKTLNFYDSNPEAEFVYTNFWFCDINLKIKNKGYCKKIPEGKTNLECDCISHFKTFRKRAYYRTEGYDEKIKYAEDKDLTFKLEEVAKPYFIDECLYFYRVKKQSQSRGTNEQLSYKNFQLAKKLARKRRGQENLKDKIENIIDKIRNFLLNLMSNKLKNK